MQDKPPEPFEVLAQLCGGLNASIPKQCAMPAWLSLHAVLMRGKPDEDRLKSCCLLVTNCRLYLHAEMAQALAIGSTRGWLVPTRV